MSNQKPTPDPDPLSEATDGRLRWDDPGMPDMEQGWQDFPLGVRVEVRTEAGWLKGTVVETINENGRAIVVKCDDPYHENEDFYNGCGATVPVYMNSRRGILANIRAINEPRQEVKPKRRPPAELTGHRAKLLTIALLMVEHSDGRLRLAFNEDDEDESFVGDAQRFLKLDDKRLGRDIELYGFMGEKILGWTATLVDFLLEVVYPLQGVLPESFEHGLKAVREFGDNTVNPELLGKWNELFTGSVRPTK